MFIEKKPEKKLTKKQLKAQEDAEFEALMAGVPVADASKGESKQADAAPKAGEGNSKNKKKKEKKKAAAAK